MKCSFVFIVLVAVFMRNEVFGEFRVEHGVEVNQENMVPYLVEVRGGLVGAVSNKCKEDYSTLLAPFSETYNHFHLCSGTIISEEWIVTTANCVFAYRNNPQYLSVVVDRVNVADVDRVFKFCIQHVFIYDDFDPITSKHDIALLKLVRELDSGFHWNFKYSKKQEKDNIYKIRLPAVLLKGTTVKITGWGETENQKPSSDQLYEVTLVTERCGLYFEDDRILYCTKPVNNNVRINYGDSGSPLVDNSGETPVLVGINSHTTGVDNVEVFAKVSAYTEWIMTTMIARPSRRP